MADGVSRPQESWTGHGVIWLYRDLTLSGADAVGIALATAGTDLSAVIGAAFLADWLRVLAVAAFMVVVQAIVWLRWRPAFGVVLVVQALVLLVLVNQALPSAGEAAHHLGSR
jgi:hypothetical protein